MERSEPTIEELLNIISFQEKIIEYYANEKNYSGKIEKMPILKDRGEQARFAMKKTEEIRIFQENIIKDLKNAIEDFDSIDTDENSTNELKKKASIITNLFKGLS